ncbi:hypothetical protein ACFQ3Z_01515 [Streptomyces nogalater]
MTGRIEVHDIEATHNTLLAERPAAAVGHLLAGLLGALDTAREEENAS